MKTKEENTGKYSAYKAAKIPFAKKEGKGQLYSTDEDSEEEKKSSGNKSKRLKMSKIKKKLRL
jgi:hypothetical protein